MMSERTSKKGTELLLDLQDQVSNVLGKAGFAAEIAEQVGAQLMAHLFEHWGGQMIYIPIGRMFTDDRDAAIYADHKAGVSYSDLATKYTLSQPFVYKIVKKMAGKERNKRLALQPLPVAKPATQGAKP